MADADNHQENWLLANFRFTGFARDVGNIVLPTFFASISGQAPEQDNANNLENSRTLIGKYEGMTCTVVSQPGRLDIVLSPDPQNPAHLQSGFPCLGLLSDRRAATQRLCTAALQQFNAFSRIAIGATYYLSVPNKTVSFVKLGEYLPSITIDANESSDFLYRINRPRVVEVANRSVVVNRVATWASIQLQTLRITVPPVEHELRQQPLFAVQLQTDINNVPEADISDFPVESKVRFVQTLEELSTEIALKGDIK